jgi:hypothetical protein
MGWNIPRVREFAALNTLESREEVTRGRGAGHHSRGEGQGSHRRHYEHSPKL